MKNISVPLLSLAIVLAAFATEARSQTLSYQQAGIAYDQVLREAYWAAIPNYPSAQAYSGVAPYGANAASATYYGALASEVAAPYRDAGYQFGALYRWYGALTASYYSAYPVQGVEVLKYYIAYARQGEEYYNSIADYYSGYLYGYADYYWTLVFPGSSGRYDYGDLNSAIYGY
jgi:hypothetical protein